MDKKKNLKIEKFKELWKNPKTHGLMVLGLYMLFFAFVFIYIQVLSQDKDKEEVEDTSQNALYTLNEMESYEYYYTFQKLEDTITSTTIDGIKYQDKNNFEVKETGTKYYIENNTIYPVSENDFNITDFYILEFEPTDIFNYINLNSSNNQVTYSDGTKKIEYIVNLKDISKYLKIDSDKLSNESIEITTYQKENEIYKIDLELTEYAKITNSKIKSYTVAIIYSNINNITSYDSDY